MDYGWSDRIHKGLIIIFTGTCIEYKVSVIVPALKEMGNISRALDNIIMSFCKVGVTNNYC